jgi:capsular polysaccharide biosynthesis protein
MTGPSLLPLVRRWGWLVGGGALVAGLIAWLLAGTAGKTYEAEAKLLVGPVNADYATLQASGALGRTYAELAHSRRLVDAAARDARVRLTRKQVRSAVTATSNDVTRILDVRVRHSDPASAMRLARGLALQLVQVRRRAPEADVDPVLAIMRDPGVTDLKAAQRRGVREALIRVIGQSRAGDLHVVEAATLPRDPVSPRVGLLVALAALAGALAMVAYAIVREGGSDYPEWDDSLDDLEIERFLPFPNGNGDAAGGSVERLDEARGGGRP